MKKAKKEAQGFFESHDALAICYYYLRRWNRSTSRAGLHTKCDSGRVNTRSWDPPAPAPALAQHPVVVRHLVLLIIIIVVGVIGAGGGVGAGVGMAIKSRSPFLSVDRVSLRSVD